MAFSTYKPRPPKNPWSQVFAPTKRVGVRKPVSRTGIPRPTPTRSPAGKFPPGYTRGQLMGGGGGSDSSDSSDGFYSFQDHTSALLAALAAARDRQLADLRGNLQGRIGAVQKLYADQIPMIQGNYGQAQKSAAAVDQAVTDELRNQGNVAGQDLLSRLSAINAPQGATDQVSKQLADYYAGAAGSNYAGYTGDIQNLITRGTEEVNYAQKQPAIIAQELQSQEADDEAQLMSDFLDRQAELQAQGFSDRDAYDQAKWEYGQQQKADKAEKAAQAEQLYWDNYWKKQEMLQRQLEIAQASRDKKAANQVKIQMQKLKNQADTDVANIRAGSAQSVAATNAAARQSAADTAAAAKVTAAGISASGKSNKAPSPNPIINSVLSQLTLTIKGVRHMRKLTDARANAIINSRLRASGIDPRSPSGQALRDNILKTIDGMPAVGGGNWSSKGTRANQQAQWGYGGQSQYNGPH